MWCGVHEIVIKDTKMADNAAPNGQGGTAAQVCAFNFHDMSR